MKKYRDNLNYHTYISFAECIEKLSIDIKECLHKDGGYHPFNVHGSMLSCLLIDVHQE